MAVWNQQNHVRSWVDKVKLTSRGVTNNSQEVQVSKKPWILPEERCSCFNFMHFPWVIFINFLKSNNQIARSKVIITLSLENNESSPCFYTFGLSRVNQGIKIKTDSLDRKRVEKVKDSTRSISEISTGENGWFFHYEHSYCGTIPSFGKEILTFFPYTTRKFVKRTN